jgi:3-methylfumaryl-CoA hydratase
MTGPVVGSTLPGFAVCPDAVQLFLFSAATWNPHRIHYDAPYVTGVEGHEGIVVHGPLMGAWLLELAQAWVDGWGEVVDVTYRNVSPALAGQRLAVSGTVAEGGDEPRAEVKVALPDGTVVCSGSVAARCNPDQANECGL